jgi:hypothetical protein
LEVELRTLSRSGAVDEVLALLHLSQPQLPVVFSAVSLGCPSTLQAVLDYGADPDETSAGISPLCLCIIVASATPMPPHAGMLRRPNLTIETAVMMVRSLLFAGATPTTMDLWRACHIQSAALGEQLLASRDGATLVGDGARPVLKLAATHCPDLVYPLLARGASLRELGGVPPGTSAGVFRDARWKLLRTLCLLHGRGCLAIPKNLLASVGAFLAEAVLFEPDAGADDMGRDPDAFLMGLNDVCTACPAPLPLFLSLPPPPLPLFSA